MEQQNECDPIGIGGTEDESSALARLLVTLDEMGSDWRDETNFTLIHALKALGAIIETLGPLLEVVLIRGAEGNALRDNPAIEQLRALHDALLDLSETGRHHPQLAPIKKKGTSRLRRDEKQLQSALVGMVKTVQILRGFKYQKQAQLFVVKTMGLKYRDAGLSQKQLADMARAVAAREKE